MQADLKRLNQVSGNMIWKSLAIQTKRQMESQWCSENWREQKGKWQTVCQGPDQTIGQTVRGTRQTRRDARARNVRHQKAKKDRTKARLRHSWASKCQIVVDSPRFAFFCISVVSISLQPSLHDSDIPFNKSAHVHFRQNISKRSWCYTNGVSLIRDRPFRRSGPVTHIDQIQNDSGNPKNFRIYWSHVVWITVSEALEKFS